MKQIIYSVTQINNQVNNLINSKYGSIWIKGHISTLKTYPSGHAYFIIKDKVSELSCVYFNYSNNHNNLKANSEVILYGSLSIYPAKGQFQLIVKNLYDQGESKYWIEYQQLKTKLKDEGIFDKKHKKIISKINERIGIITSSSGSVLYDVLKILKRRAPYVEISILSNRVQGDLAYKEIINSLSKMNNEKNIDLILLVRGGGSIEDLSCFNNEKLVREIHISKIPIITGIGHETNITLSDYAADLSTATPSEAAEICTMNIIDILDKFSQYNKTISNTIYYKMKDNLNNLEKLRLKIFAKSPLFVLNMLNQKLDYSYSKLISKTDNSIKLYANKIISFNKLINSINIIKRSKKLAFPSIYKDKKNITSIHDLAINDEILIELIDGEVVSKIKRKLYNEKK